MLRNLIFLCAIVAAFPFGAVAAPLVGEAPQPVPAWIWKSAKPGPTERVFFRREIELPPDIASGSITVTCDNWHRLIVNGHDLGMSNEWQNARHYDVLDKLLPGSRNIIAVEGRNEGGIAGMALRFRVKLTNGKTLQVVSDGSWQCSNEAGDGWQKLDFPAATNWPKAVVVGQMGDAPWGNALPPDVEDAGKVKDVTGSYRVAPDFKLERMYQVPAGAGSWVAMTVDGEGHLLCSDQYGKVYRVTLPADEHSETTVKPVDLPLQGAHGLLWMDGTLWITVNEGSDQSGVWRAKDAGDGRYEKPELVKAVQGRGEHGPHALVAGPDGKSIYLVAGNHTDLPKMDFSLPAEVWAEDQLLPRRPDARGHARDRMAPGGWIARFTLDGKNWQLFASGFRNAYDIAFSDSGDLFTYDSDMEWDLGMPWYRPTRICHVVPGAEFGWRNGTGKWPDYYEDSMPALIDIGPGSPTGVLSGRGAKFPAKYQQAIFAADWTFATLYAVHLTPDGTGFRATSEEFVAGEGLPLTDLAVGPDGAIYFLTGGRRTDSALWRVSYTGSESTAAVAKPAAPSGPVAEDRALLQAASLGNTEAAAGKLDMLWAQIGSDERLQRYSARLVLERIPVNTWGARLTAEENSWRIITAAIAIARTGNNDQALAAMAALDRVDWGKLDRQQQLTWLRAAGLVFARHGDPAAGVRDKVLAKIDAAFPATDDALNRELCRLLSYLQAPGVVARTLNLMDNAGPSPAPNWLELAKRNASYGKTVEQMIANLPPAQVIHYVYCLRVVKGPWRTDERKRFFSWLARLSGNKGGESYGGFITDLRNETLATSTPEERVWVAELPTGAPPNPFANLPPIQGPGRDWTVDEVEALTAEGLNGRNLAHGKEMYRAALCAACHRFGGEGGAAGPDLTALAGRFNVRDLADSIIHPSKVISDQFAFDLIVRKDGTEVTGKITGEKDNKWLVATSPFDFTQTIEIEQNDIKEVKSSPISPMPPALINRLNPDELKDLLAYLLGK